MFCTHCMHKQVQLQHLTRDYIFKRPVHTSNRMPYANLIICLKPKTVHTLNLLDHQQYYKVHTYDSLYIALDFFLRILNAILQNAKWFSGHLFNLKVSHCCP